MRKIWIGPAFAAIIATPTAAQQHVVECAQQVGMRLDPSYDQKIQSAGGRVLRRWYFNHDAQQAAFNDCIAGKASLAAKPSAKTSSRASQ
ncbi:MAG TPA: hypothetical protein VLJ17_15555 [Xanthobacteraceae bacterium]|nr:hypothetical protein [Xanthobacteraceae bacterium]